MLLFILLGLGAGGVYALLALGLVLQYRSSGVINFAHGAVAMFVAYVFVRLRVNGELEMPWPIFPHTVPIDDAGVSTVPALALSLGIAALMGVLLFVLIFRPLRQQPALARVAASVGVLLYLQATAVLNFGTDAATAPPVLPSETLAVAGLNVPVDRFWLAGLSVVAAAGLGLVFAFTRFGLATRAAAGNARGAALIGLSADRLALVNWVAASLLAGLGGILILPISALEPQSYSLLVIPALGVALLARFTSFTVTVVAGLSLGVLQSVLIKVQTDWSWVPQNGLRDGLPFVVIVIAMTVLARGLSNRGEAVEHQATVGRPRRPVTTGLACLLVGTVAILVTDGSNRTSLITSLITACTCLSLVVLTGYVGQVSLAQMALVGIGGFTLAHIVERFDLPLLLTLLVAALVSTVVGLVIALPAIRVRGVNLAVVTLAAAAAFYTLVFNSSWFGGGFGGLTVPSPTIAGFELSPSGGGMAQVGFGLLVLVLVVLVGIYVGRLRGAPLGLILLAVRGNERAATSIGIDVAGVKLVAFGISAFIAGLAGGLLAYQQQSLTPSGFSAFASVSLLAIAYVGGIGRISGAVLAGLMLAPAGLFSNLINHVFDLGTYQPLIAGFGLIIMAVHNPEGLAGLKAPGWFGSLGRRHGRTADQARESALEVAR
jgi:branched-subunit amino acid ABC-type transport system permease component